MPKDDILDAKNAASYELDTTSANFCVSNVLTSANFC